MPIAPKLSIDPKHKLSRERNYNNSRKRQSLLQHKIWESPTSALNASMLSSCSSKRPQKSESQCSTFCTILGYRTTRNGKIEKYGQAPILHLILCLIKNQVIRRKKQDVRVVTMISKRQSIGSSVIKILKVKTQTKQCLVLLHRSGRKIWIWILRNNSKSLESIPRLAIRSLQTFWPRTLNFKLQWRSSKEEKLPMFLPLFRSGRPTGFTNTRTAISTPT